MTAVVALGFALWALLVGTARLLLPWSQAPLHPPEVPDGEVGEPRPCVEGSWFRATERWESLVRPYVEASLAAAPGGNTYYYSQPFYYPPSRTALSHRSSNRKPSNRPLPTGALTITACKGKAPAESNSHSGLGSFHSALVLLLSSPYFH